MQKITLAFGAHEQATDALRWSAELAHLTHTPLEVVNVFEPSYAEVSPEHYQRLAAERRQTIGDIIENFADVDGQVVILEGHEPLMKLALYIEESPGSLGVIGVSDTQGFGGWGFGRPAHTLLHHTTQPIAMIPPGYEPIAGGVITVGVDGSGANALAVEWAEQLAAATGATLHAVFAYDPMDDTFLLPEDWHRHSDEVRRVVEKVAAAPVELFMAAGHPSQVLIEHAQRTRCAAVIVGTRGRGGFEGLVLGRVPAQLLAHTTCPLIVVPH